MTVPFALAIAMTVAVVVAWVRLLMWSRRKPGAARPWRLALLVAMQPLCATLLYLALAPPPLAAGAETLVVATRGARSGGGLAGLPGVALPEAPASAGFERTPDLGTALRRHPGVRLRVVGEGLEVRDRDAARGATLTYDPPPPPHGLIRLEPPPPTAPGAGFRVGGQIRGVPGGSVEFYDPAGRKVDAAPLPADGVFALVGAARAPGGALFRVQVLDGARRTVEEVDTPVSTVGETPPRVLLLGGAPGPEIKYLRRWATDAGVPLHSQLSVGRGLELGDAPLPLDATTLARFDVAIVDERSWGALGGGERAALQTAVRSGLGLLLRVTGPLPEDLRRQWRDLGMELSAGADVAPATPPPDAAAATQAKGEGPDLTRQMVQVAGADVIPLLRDTTGAALASWRAEGRGRVGVWTLTDTFGLVTSGQGERYGELWGQALATLARPRAGSTPRIEGLPRAEQRVVICGLPPQARVSATDAPPATLLVDPRAGSGDCAGYWPRTPGWKRVEGAGPDGGVAWLFYVQPAEAAPGVRAEETREATLRLAAEGPAKLVGGGRIDPSGPSWPWFLAWLLASAALWTFERGRWGRSAPAAA